MSSHDGAVGCADGREEIVSVVLRHGEEKVLAEGTHLHLVSNSLKTVILQLNTNNILLKRK